MANPEHVRRLLLGTEAWNQWRSYNQDGSFLHYSSQPRIDLSNWDAEELRLFEWERFLHRYIPHPSELAELHEACAQGELSEDLLSFGWQALDGANLAQVNLSWANLYKLSLAHSQLFSANLQRANLSKAWLFDADLRKADLSGACLSGAVLRYANLSGARLSKANLVGADLSGANLTGANLEDADLTNSNLEGVTLVDARASRAKFTGSRVYGVSIWNLDTTDAQQHSVIITRREEPAVTVDDLDVAQFLYLVLTNANVRRVLDTVTSKVVLILGRFSAQRMKVLDEIRSILRARNYVPVLFDFEPLATRDLTETVSTIAHMARFVLADITDSRSVPQELQRIVPDLPSVPVQPILLSSQQPYAMFEHFRRYPWVFSPVLYSEEISALGDEMGRLIDLVELRMSELRGVRR